MVKHKEVKELRAGISKATVGFLIDYMEKTHGYSIYAYGRFPEDVGSHLRKHDSMHGLTMQIGNKPPVVLYNEDMPDEEVVLTLLHEMMHMLGGDYLHEDREPVTLTVEASVSAGGTLSYQWYKEGQEIEGAVGTSYSPPTGTAENKTYYVKVTNTNNAVTGNKTAGISSNDAVVTVSNAIDAQIPSITQHPQNRNVLAGEQVTLTVGASVSDGGALSYQWHNSAEEINGATGTSYSPPTGMAGSETYRVKVTNTNNAATGQKTATAWSNSATVVVTMPDQVRISSASSTRVTAGKDGSFQVTATGSPAPTFSLTGQPGGVYIDAVSGWMSFPADMPTGTYAFAIMASNVYASDTQTFTLTVAPTTSGDAEPTIYSDELEESRRYEQAIVIHCKEWANVRSGPGTNYEIVGQVVLGETIELLEWNKDESWCKVTYNGGSKLGWLWYKFIKPIQ